MRLAYTFVSLALYYLGCSNWAQAQSSNDSGQSAEKPLLAWQFSGKAEPGLPKPSERKLEAGPRSPKYPGFPADNLALVCSGATTALTLQEADLPNTKLRFAQGETITLEAWVKIRELKEGSYAYILGKGRSQLGKFPEKNQNYALRLHGEKAGAKLSFLFASDPEKDKPSEFHRWTSKDGFSHAGWHHVAVVYTFGKPTSIRGYIDGQKVSGVWDMGGATERPPVTDADVLQLGTGNGGGANNSLLGWLDEVKLWRSGLSEETLRSRYQVTIDPPVVERSKVPTDHVLVQLCEEGLPTRNAWPDTPPNATETYREEALGFSELPVKYIATGVRADRANPTLLRALTRLTLPAGKHRILLRARGAAKLSIAGKVLLTTPFPPQDTSGHGKVLTQAQYLDLGPTFRLAPPGNREAWCEYTSTGAEVVVMLETLVGGFIGNSKRRPELGETVVAWAAEKSDAWQLLSPGARQVPYTDAGWSAYEADRSAHYAQVNAANRAKCRAEHEAYWQGRRAAGAAWLKSTPAVPVPTSPKEMPSFNSIDHFLNVKIQRVAQQHAEVKPGAVDFYKQIQPILEAKCVGCHAGGKAKGGLRLDERAAALKGGKHDGPALSPKNPDKSALLQRVRSTEPTEVMPPKGDKLSAEQQKLLEQWIREGAVWPEVNDTHTTLTGLCDDLTFLRRATLDTVGVVPTLAEIRAFQQDSSPNKRAKAIDRLLSDSRWADHWLGYWQDVLAENPNILNPTLNNTGPFRFWLYETLLDNKPMDLFVTELIRMQGSERFGGPAGFGVASQNDVPMAAKGTIVSTAFLGIEMKCARCHDAPAHRSTQQELFQLGALLAGKTLTVPASSSVPLDRIHQGGRNPLINVTLKPGTAVPASWPFPELIEEKLADKLSEHPDQPRDRLAALLTAPQNERFAQVLANRVWARFMGRGLVEPLDDWERASPTHPELLQWLGREVVRQSYDVKQLAKLIMSSHAYQRASARDLATTGSLYAAPAPRKLAAEQIVDSLFLATGKPFHVEEMSLDIDGQRDLGNSISLGKPRRAWMLTSTSNERDRPSLALPRIQAVVDVLQAFGWRGARQDPSSQREVSPNVLQPAILSNGVMGGWLCRLSDDHGVTADALQAKNVEELIESLFLRMLTRLPTEDEKQQYRAYLSEGFATRVLPTKPRTQPNRRRFEPYVSWSNHLDPNATLARQEQEAAARRGDPATDKLEARWRGRLEDVLWALLNSSEILFTR